MLKDALGLTPARLRGIEETVIPGIAKVFAPACLFPRRKQRVHLLEHRKPFEKLALQVGRKHFDPQPRQLRPAHGLKLFPREKWLGHHLKFLGRDPCDFRGMMQPFLILLEAALFVFFPAAAGTRIIAPHLGRRTPQRAADVKHPIRLLGQKTQRVGVRFLDDEFERRFNHIERRRGN